MSYFNKEEEGFCDFALSINNYYQDDKCNHVVNVTGMYKDTEVGFNVIFLGGMEPGVVDGKFNNAAFYPNGITIQSVGEQSDNFIIAMSELYGIKIKKGMMIDCISLTSIALQGNPNNLTEEDIKFKVFFDDNIEKGLYFEAFINICLVDGILEFNEKDTEYRSNITKAFTGMLPNFFIRKYKKIFGKI